MVDRRHARAEPGPHARPLRHLPGRSGDQALGRADPITITGNAGAEAELGCSFELDAANTKLTVGGSAEGFLYGWAGVHVGVACLYIGADLRLEFGRSELSLDIAASSGVLGGTLRYGITPVRLILDLVVSACVARKSWTLVDLAMDEITGSKRLF
ncbi:MAG: hypothetical protein IPN34_12895 [Planctomycetes bacterium]|nr:hypothetical protein [Planctomycetota bacterium]